MLVRNRFGVLISRPWRLRKNTVRFASLTPPNLDGQRRAYDASPKLRDSVPVVVAIRHIGDRNAPGTCEVWTS